MVGLERSILPILARQEFAIAVHSAALSFIAVFGHHQGAHQLLGRPRRRSARTPPTAHRWLARCGSGALDAYVGVDMDVRACRQWAARHQSGTNLVDHGHHEDRSRRAEAARARDATQRVRRLRRRRGGGVRDRLGGGGVRAASCAVLSRRRIHRRRPVALPGRASYQHARRARIRADASISCQRRRSVLAHNYWRSHPVFRLSGGARQQPERRDGVGAVADRVRGRRPLARTGWRAGGRVPGDVGPGAAGDRRAVESDRPESG